MPITPALRRKHDEIVKSYVGQRVRIVGDHPDNGRTGVIDGGAEKPGTALGFVVKLDDGQPGTSCFVFHGWHMTFI